VRMDVDCGRRINCLIHKHLSILELHVPVSLCHVNADLISGIGPPEVCNGMKRLRSGVSVVPIGATGWCG
jgi:hypothetical protein